MSLRPGIGADAMWEVASLHMEYNLEEFGDVISALRHGKQIRPYGRYLTRKLREYTGRDPSAPASVIEKKNEELRPLREIAEARTKNKELQKTNLKNLIIDEGEAKINQMEKKQLIFKKRGTL